MTARQKQSEDERSGLFFATVFGAVAGTNIGFSIPFVWWLAIIEFVFGLALHVYVENQRQHAGSILLAFVGTVLICIAVGPLGLWLRA